MTLPYDSDAEERKIRLQELHARDVLRESMPHLADVASSMSWFRDAAARHAVDDQDPKPWDSYAEQIRKELIEKIGVAEQRLIRLRTILESAEDG